MKKHKTITFVELYNYYELVAAYPQVSREKWIKVVKELMYKISEAMIKDNLVVKLGSNLGYVGVVKRNKTRVVDFKNTNPEDGVIQLSNRHSNYQRFGFKWGKGHPTNRYKSQTHLYSFVAIRDAYRYEIGLRGLKTWIVKCSEDPYIKDYDAPQKLI